MGEEGFDVVVGDGEVVQGEVGEGGGEDAGGVAEDVVAGAEEARGVGVQGQREGEVGEWCADCGGLVFVYGGGVEEIVVEESDDEVRVEVREAGDGELGKTWQTAAQRARFEAVEAGLLGGFDGQMFQCGGEDR